MPDLKEKAEALISSTSGVDMKTAASTTLYIVPTGKTLRITKVVVRDTTASLAGGTSYSVTNFRQTFSLVNVTTANTGYTVIQATDLAQYTENGAGTTIQWTVTTGATAAGTATIDVYGYLT